jgi:hypothetical protein
MEWISGLSNHDLISQGHPTLPSLQVTAKWYQTEMGESKPADASDATAWSDFLSQEES